MSEVTNKYAAVANSSEIDLIQNEIEVYTKKIEHEKINLRLANERRDKQLSLYLQLQGLPQPFKTKEQKEKEKKERKEQKEKRMNNRFRLYEVKSVEPTRPEKLFKEINKNEMELDKVIFVLN